MCSTSMNVCLHVCVCHYYKWLINKQLINIADHLLSCGASLCLHDGDGSTSYTHTHIHAYTRACLCVSVVCHVVIVNEMSMAVCLCVYVSEDQCVPILIVLIDKWVKFVIYTHLYSHKYLIACVLVNVSSCSYIMYIHNTYVHMNLTDSIYIITKLRSRDCFNARNFSNSRNEAISLTHTHIQAIARMHTHTHPQRGRQTG